MTCDAVMDVSTGLGNTGPGRCCVIWTAVDHITQCAHTDPALTIVQYWATGTPDLPSLLVIISISDKVV